MPTTIYRVFLDKVRLRQVWSLTEAMSFCDGFMLGRKGVWKRDGDGYRWVSKSGRCLCIQWETLPCL